MKPVKRYHNGFVPKHVKKIAITFLAKKIGTLNAFGDEQTDADIKAEEICVKHFKKTEVIRSYMSKESLNVY